MKADITRRTFRQPLHYAAALQQQGRVPMDADWNEQVDIQQHHDEVEAIDVIGQSGFPRGDSFLVELAPDGADLRLHPGRGWVDGILCECDAGQVAVAVTASNVVTPLTWTLDDAALRLGEWVEISTGASDARVYRVTAVDAASLALTLDVGGDDLIGLYGAAGQAPRIARVVTYVVQPEWPVPDDTTWPDPPSLPSWTPPQSGLYLAYLDVWRRHVTALEDPAMREVALGGPDTCTRLRTTWQLRLAYLGADTGSTDCASAALPTSTSTGQLAARALIPSADTPCVLAPTARYRSLENQLYRVEIHDPGELGTATFKFSADNGTIVSSWIAQSGLVLTVSSIGRDSVLTFSQGQWIEITDDTRELAGLPGELRLVDSVDGDDITISGTEVDIADFPRNPRIRRWDQVSAGAVLVEQPSTNDGFLTLDDSGVEVRFEAGYYNTGDYWLIPARTITTDVEWPKSELGSPLAQPRQGVEHHYARLALVSWDGSQLEVVSDCRPQFPPLTDIHAKDVKMDPTPCDFPPDVVTVQDAISAICRQKANACCELVIAPGDDVQLVVEAALARNSMLGIRGLHVCFAAGTHTLRRPLVIDAPKGGGDIAVSGCGLAAHVESPSSNAAIVLRGWDSATVKELSVAAGSGGKGAPRAGAVTMLDCAVSVVENAAIRCAAGSRASNACVGIQYTAVPNTSAARVTSCDLAVGHQQVGVLVIGVDRSTIDNNRLDVAPAEGGGQAPPVQAAFQSEVRRSMFHDLRIGTAAGKTVPTPDGVVRNHFTADGLKVAFSSDAALAGPWAAYMAAHGSRLIARVARRRGFAGTRGADVAQGEPAPAVKVPNAVATRIRTRLDRMLGRMVRVLGGAKASPAETQQMAPFQPYFQAAQQAFVARLGVGIAVVGQLAGDVRILDNTVATATEGIRVAVRAGGTTMATPLAARVTRARVSGNSVDLAAAAGRRGAGIAIGSCASLVLESNYVRRASGNGMSDGIRVIGLLGKMMRAEGNHAQKVTVGIRVVVPKNADATGALWILSQNVAEAVPTPIIAPAAAVLVHNAP